MKRLGVDIPVSSTDSIARLLEREVDASAIKQLVSVNRGKASISELEIPKESPLHGKTWGTEYACQLGDDLHHPGRGVDHPPRQHPTIGRGQGDGAVQQRHHHPVAEAIYVVGSPFAEQRGWIEKERTVVLSLFFRRFA